MRVGISWLDVKLGIRMLARYPGLSIAGGLAIVMVVVCGAAAGMFHAVVFGALPFGDGGRIVAIENWDTRENRPHPVAFEDFAAWRGMTSLDAVGAYRLVTRNVAIEGEAAEPVRVAEIGAEAFAIARVAPRLGRYLAPEDERDGAPPVIVIGHAEWQRRFAGDPRVIGRTLLVGGTPATIVGVMPEGFGFPVNERHWVPLRLVPSDFAHAPAPSSMPYKQMPPGAVHAFGRLAPGADLAAAQAELAVLGERASQASPATHAHVRPRVLPYTRWFFDEQHDGEIFLVQGLVLLLLGLVGANVAVLVYARTAARRMEIAVRTALGASRGRIVGQMFVEGLVLSGAAAAAGLMLAGIIRSELAAYIPWHLAPFWVTTSATSSIVLAYVAALALLGGVVIGVIPAMQATSRRAQAGLQHAASSASGWRIGRTYGVLMVAQVAVTVAILPYALSTAWTSVRDALADPGYPAGQFLTARIDVEPGLPPAAAAARLRDRRAEIARRLAAEPGVTDVTFLAGLPGGEPARRIEIEGEPVFRQVGVGRIGVDFVPLFEVPVLAGRPFAAGDTGAGGRHVVVNRSFARHVLGGAALGRRIRPATGEPGPWLEVVGVIEDVPATATGPALAQARLYLPAGEEDAGLGLLAARVRAGEPAKFASRLREVAAAVDPGLLLDDVRPMMALVRDQRRAAQVGAGAAGFFTLSLLLLSATGLYALMSFTVTQRRREIGIRVALGATTGRLLRSIFARALGQLAAGIVLGMAVAGMVAFETGGESTGAAGLLMLPIVAVFVLAVGLLAVAGPTRRGLRIEPSEALKEG